MSLWVCGYLFLFCMIHFQALTSRGRLTDANSEIRLMVVKPKLYQTWSARLVKLNSLNLHASLVQPDPLLREYMKATGGWSQATVKPETAWEVFTSNRFLPSIAVYVCYHKHREPKFKTSLYSAKWTYPGRWPSVSVLWATLFYSTKFTKFICWRKIFCKLQDQLLSNIRTWKLQMESCSHFAGNCSIFAVYYTF